MASVGTLPHMPTLDRRPTAADLRAVTDRRAKGAHITTVLLLAYSSVDVATIVRESTALSDEARALGLATYSIDASHPVTTLTVVTDDELAHYHTIACARQAERRRCPE
jgi:hypothetical protein